MLSDQNISGEYWITNTGKILDADNGTNHIYWACVHAISLIYKAVHNDPVAEALFEEIGVSAEHWEDDTIGFREALLNASDTLSRQPKYAELYEDFEQCLLRAGVTQEIMDALWSQDVDPRLWVMSAYGWIVVRPDCIVLNGLSDSKVRLLRDCLWDIVMREGLHTHNLEFTIFDNFTETRYEATFESLNDGFVSSLHRVACHVAIALPGR